MAPALQCPKCGARNGPEAYEGVDAFACPSCGQRLKVPAQLRSSPSAPSRAPVAPRAASATASATAPPPSPDGAVSGRRPERDRPRAVWRILAWFVAVFLGGFLVFVGGRAVGYLDGQRALDLVVSSGISRYTVLLPLIPIWAVITTVLVTVFIDGGQALARRRRSRAVPRRDEPVPASGRGRPAPPPDRGPDDHGVADDPPPVRRPGEGRRAGGHPG